MGRPVVPIDQLAHRLPTAGRIRIGRKVPTRNGKVAPQALDKFRFTSSDPQALAQIAEHYGGEVKPWSDPLAAPGQFEVYSDASEIRIALPPDPLGGSPNYELWSKGGRARNCDGETCEMLVQGADGIEQQECPCLCWAQQERVCELKTRLSVLLPDVRFIGVWRIDSKADAVAHEMPGMVELIQSLQTRGIVRALLRIESRRQVIAGETKQFKVPVLGLDESVNALASGMASLGHLGTGSSVPVAELGAGSTEGEESGPADLATPDTTPGHGGSPSVDDEVIDAEIVEDSASGLAGRIPAGVSANRALVAARDAAKAMQVDPPTSIDQVTDERLIGATLDLLGVS